MTAHKALSIITAFAVLVSGAKCAWADNDVTIVTPPSSNAKSPDKTDAVADDSAPIHKSSHKKKKSSATASNVGTPVKVPATDAKPASVAKAGKAPIAPAASSTLTAPIPPALSSATAPAGSVIAIPKITPPPPVGLSGKTVAGSDAGPTVETGLPIARHTGPMGEVAVSPIPVGSILPSSLQNMTSPYRGLSGDTVSSSPAPSGAATTLANYSASTRPASPSFPFVNFERKARTTYPWKSSIITTVFWIGEGGSSISSTDNIASSWDEDWLNSNHGSDRPDSRNGYAASSHASTVNPFYIALPFNDLYCPDKARRWVPDAWHRPMKDGKQVSACKDRWVEIKNAQGRTCYAQWEDVGPLRYDHAEYVFGNERPDTYTRAGLDISPAVAQYLGIDQDHKAYTSWRFVEDEDVPPGAWLKYEEEALILKVLLRQRSSGADLDVQRGSLPVDDGLNSDSNKRRVGAAKG